MEYGELVIADSPRPRFAPWLLRSFEIDFSRLIILGDLSDSVSLGLLEISRGRLGLDGGGIFPWRGGGAISPWCPRGVRARFDPWLLRSIDVVSSRLIIL
jgi:hypothetical protein